jgi:hypothetical protein
LLTAPQTCRQWRVARDKGVDSDNGKKAHDQISLVWAFFLGEFIQLEHTNEKT